MTGWRIDSERCEIDGYQTKKALFKKMKNCSIVLLRDNIVFSPVTMTETIAGVGVKGDWIEDVIVTAGSSTEEFGAASHLAFSRCTE